MGLRHSVGGYAHPPEGLRQRAADAQCPPFLETFLARHLRRCNDLPSQRSPLPSWGSTAAVFPAMLTLPAALAGGRSDSCSAASKCRRSRTADFAVVIEAAMSLFGSDFAAEAMPQRQRRSSVGRSVRKMGAAAGESPRVRESPADRIWRCALPLIRTPSVWAQTLRFPSADAGKQRTTERHCDYRRAIGMRRGRCASAAISSRKAKTVC
jgi:hypothetical protein